MSQVTAPASGHCAHALRPRLSMSSPAPHFRSQVGQAAAAWRGRLSFLSPLFGRLSPPIGLAGHTLSCPLPMQCTWAGLPWADLPVRRRCPEGPGGLRIWPASP